MKTKAQEMTDTRCLSAIALLSYSVSLCALLAFGYSVITLALDIAGQEIGAIYSPYGL